MFATRSDALVIFGVTGDLAHKAIFPALYALVKSGALTVPVVGVASPKWTQEQLRDRVEDSVPHSGGIDDPARAPSFDNCSVYVSGDYKDAGDVRRDQEGARLRRSAPPIISRSRLHCSRR